MIKQTVQSLMKLFPGQFVQALHCQSASTFILDPSLSSHTDSDVLVF